MNDVIRANVLGSDGTIDQGILDQKINYLVGHINNNLQQSKNNHFVMTDDYHFNSELLIKNRCLILKNIEVGLSLINCIPEEKLSAELSGHKQLLGSLREDCYNLPDDNLCFKQQEEEEAFSSLVKEQNPINHGARGLDAVFDVSLLGLDNE